MATTPGNLDDEVAKHFQGTPVSRLRTARRLGRRAVELFRASLPKGTTLKEAREEMQARIRRGRRRSGAIEALRR